MVFVHHLPTALRLLGEINMEHLRELQRFAEAGRVSAGLIHDMSSPLTAAILHLEQEDPKRLPNVRHARRSIQVLERYIEAARRQLCQQDNTTIFCVRHEIRQVKYILQPLARRRQIRLRFNTRVENCNLLGDPVKFQRIIINLVTNAMDAYEESPAPSGHIVRVIVNNDHQNLIITVRDRGKGIEADQFPHLFKPFYSTKHSASADSGMGIGLSTIRQYVEEVFGGTITARCGDKKGTEFQVKLPLHSY